jgi:hypothetical protein
MDVQQEIRDIAKVLHEVGDRLDDLGYELDVEISKTGDPEMVKRGNMRRARTLTRIASAQFDDLVCNLNDANACLRAADDAKGGG